MRTISRSALLISAIFVVIGLAAQVVAEDWRFYVRASGVIVFPSESDLNNIFGAYGFGTADLPC